MGINLGPTRMAKNLNGQVNIIGDGINAAQRVMSFADPGQLLVSRSYYEVVSSLLDDYSNLFTHQGSRTDKHVRAHEVYSVGSSLAGERSAGEADPRSAAIGVAAVERDWRGKVADTPAKILDTGG